MTLIDSLVERCKRELEQKIISESRSSEIKRQRLFEDRAHVFQLRPRSGGGSRPSPMMEPVQPQAAQGGC